MFLTSEKRGPSCPNWWEEEELIWEMPESKLSFLWEIVPKGIPNARQTWKVWRPQVCRLKALKLGVKNCADITFGHIPSNIPFRCLDIWTSCYGRSLWEEKQKLRSCQFDMLFPGTCANNSFFGKKINYLQLHPKLLAWPQLQHLLGNLSAICPILSAAALILARTSAFACWEKELQWIETLIWKPAFISLLLMLSIELGIFLGFLLKSVIVFETFLTNVK